MARILLVYGTRQSHTADIATRIATKFRGAGHQVDLRNLRTAPASAAGYDAVVVGASVHAQKYEPEVRRWVRANAPDFATRPNAFFSVCLASANDDERSNAEVNQVIDRFVDETGWHPARVERFAGALVYSKYNWFLRRVMRRIVRKESSGRYTDMSRDYDLTDYARVDAFASEFAQQLAASAA